jgi:hypothetical protein
MKYNWIKQVPNYLDYFTEDQKKMIELIGLDNYMKVHDYFGGTGFYFSKQPLMGLKKAWAQNNRNVHYNDAARILDVSKSAIYNWRDEDSQHTSDFFPENKKEF